MKQLLVTLLLGLAMVRPAAADLINEVSYSVGPATRTSSYGDTYLSGWHEDQQLLSDMEFTMPEFDQSMGNLLGATLTFELKAESELQVTNLSDSTYASFGYHRLLMSSYASGLESFFGYACVDPACSFNQTLAPGEMFQSEWEIERELQWNLTDSDLSDFLTSGRQVRTNFRSVASSSGVWGLPRLMSLNQDAWAQATITYRYSVPEPGSLALLGIGIVGLAWVRRRKH